MTPNKEAMKTIFEALDHLAQQEDIPGYLRAGGWMRGTFDCWHCPVALYLNDVTGQKCVVARPWSDKAYTGPEDNLLHDMVSNPPAIRAFIVDYDAGLYT